MKKQILGLSSNLRFFLYQEPISMQGGIERLKGVVVNELGMDPTNGDVYIFLSKNRKTIKLLYFEQNVFTLYTRRVYNGTFVYPIIQKGEDKIYFDWYRLKRLIRGYSTVKLN